MAHELTNQQQQQQKQRYKLFSPLFVRQLFETVSLEKLPIRCACL